MPKKLIQRKKPNGRVASGLLSISNIGLFTPTSRTSLNTNTLGKKLRASQLPAKTGISGREKSARTIPRFSRKIENPKPKSFPKYLANAKKRARNSSIQAR